MAMRLRRSPEGCIFHSDCSSQYCACDCQKRLQKYKLTPSMSCKGNCYDNVSTETFFKTIKAELIWRTKFDARADAHGAIARYIDGFYYPPPATIRGHVKAGKTPLCQSIIF
jgi:putative transposase